MASAPHSAARRKRFFPPAHGEASKTVTPQLWARRMYHRRMAVQLDRPLAWPDKVPATPEIVAQHVRNNWKGLRCIYVKRVLGRKSHEPLNTIAIGARPGEEPDGVDEADVCKHVMAIVESRVLELGEGGKFWIACMVTARKGEKERPAGKRFDHGLQNDEGYREERHEDDDADDKLIGRLTSHIDRCHSEIIGLSQALAGFGKTAAEALADANRREREANLAWVEAMIERERTRMGGAVQLEEVKQKGELLDILKPAVEVGVMQAMEAMGLGDKKAIGARLRARKNGGGKPKAFQFTGKRPALQAAARPAASSSTPTTKTEEDTGSDVVDLARDFVDTLSEDQWATFEKKLSPAQLAAVMRATRATDDDTAARHIHRMGTGLDMAARLELAAVLDDDQKKAIASLWRAGAETVSHESRPAETDSGEAAPSDTPPTT